MIKVETFRTFDVYNRSNDLSMAIKQATKSCNADLTEQEIGVLNKKVVIIPTKVAAAIAQVNLKVRFKKLNEAKSTLIQLQTIMLDLTVRKKIDEQSWVEVEELSIEVMKLLNGYFGWISGRKQKSNYD
jgi:hypothetical protein